MTTYFSSSNLLFLIALVLLGAFVLRIEDKGVTLSFFTPTVLVLLFSVCSVLLTSTGETFAARYLNLRSVVLFIVASAVFYSIALSVNSKPDGSVYLPYIFIAFIWNILNTIVTTLFGLAVDKRFMQLSTLDKSIFVVTVVVLLAAGALIFYLNNRIDKIRA